MRNLYVHKTPEITRRNPSESTVVIGCFRYCNPVISGNPSQQPLFEGSLCKPEIPCAVGVAVRCEPTRGALATPRFSPSSLSTVQYRLWWVTIAHRRTFAERGIFRVRSECLPAPVLNRPQIGTHGRTRRHISSASVISVSRSGSMMTSDSFLALKKARMCSLPIRA